MAEYFTSGQARWLHDKRQDGQLVLDDNSVWQVTPEQWTRVNGWVRFSNILVEYKPDYLGDRYFLVNTSYGETVAAKYSGKTALVANSRQRELLPRATPRS